MDDRKLAGVAAALARRVGLDATLVRGAGVLATLALALCWWPALLLVALGYAALVYLIPSE